MAVTPAWSSAPLRMKPDEVLSPFSSSTADSVDLQERGLSLPSAASAPEVEEPTLGKRAFTAASLLALGLAGLLPGAGHAAAAEIAPKPATAVSQVKSSSERDSSNTQDFIIAAPNQVGTVGSAPPITSTAQTPAPQQAAPATQPQTPATPKPVTLPTPNAHSRRIVDRVELNARFERIAAEVGVDPELVKAIGWQESNWLHTRYGEITMQANKDAATGEVKSIDSGIMQINSSAHPRAFPAASTLDGNIRYGARLIKKLTADGLQNIWKYNGDPLYGPQVLQNLQNRPWTVGVLRDQVRSLQNEKAALDRSVPKEEKALPGVHKQVEWHRQNVAAWEQKSERSTAAATRKANEKELGVARRQLERAEKKLTDAEAQLQANNDRLAALPAEIDATKALVTQESARVRTAESGDQATTRERLSGEVAAHVQRLATERKALMTLSARLDALAKKGKDVAEQQGSVKSMRAQLQTAEATWKQAGTRLHGKRRVNLRLVEKDLRDARRELDRVTRRGETVRSAIAQMQTPPRTKKTP